MHKAKRLRNLSLNHPLCFSISLKIILLLSSLVFSVFLYQRSGSRSPSFPSDLSSDIVPILPLPRLLACGARGLKALNLLREGWVGLLVDRVLLSRPCLETLFWTEYTMATSRGLVFHVYPSPQIAILNSLIGLVVKPVLHLKTRYYISATLLSC